MMHVLPSEHDALQAVPPALLAGWNIQPETLKSFESDRQIWIRANMAEFKSAPELHELVTDVLAAKTINLKPIKNLPEELLPELLFTIGARGITQIIAALLLEPPTKELIESIAGFTHLRHDILEANAAHPAA
jgi:hypothetical protein